MEEIRHLLLLNGLAIGGMMLVLWLFSLRLRDASIVDRFWGFGFVVVALLTLWRGEGYSGRALLLAILAGVWGLRLTYHISRRNWGDEEDYRYQKMRRFWGDRFWWVSLFVVFGLQGVLQWLVSLPLQIGGGAPEPARFVLFDLVGAAVWLGGFLFEAVGDAQLRRFKEDPGNRGKVMDRGLWRYTRHPNYFGDAVVWWGLFLVSLATPAGWWSLVSPLVMTFLLTRISGVPMLERHLRRSRPGYEEYARRTSSFFPLPPKSPRD